MDPLIEIQRLEREAAQTRSILGGAIATIHGELIATNLWVHALVATHPDLKALRHDVNLFAKQKSDMQPSVKAGYDGAMAALLCSLDSAAARQQER